MRKRVRVCERVKKLILDSPDVVRIDKLEDCEFQMLTRGCEKLP